MFRKFKFSIGWIIGLGFGLLIVFIIAINYKTLQTLGESKEINTKIVDVHAPSVDALQELKIEVLNSYSYIQFWIREEGDIRHATKQNLIKLIEEEYPPLKQKVLKLSKDWTPEEIKGIERIFKEIDILFGYHEVVKSTLQSIQDYQEPLTYFEMLELIEERGRISEQTAKVLEMLDLLILSQRKNTESDTENILSSFDELNFLVRKLGVVIIIVAIFIAVFTIRLILKPVNLVKNQLLMLGKGIIPNQKINTRNDEIGEMAMALNNLLDGFNRTKEFAKEVGAGNFQVSYKPLSDQDILGHSLLRMKNDLFSLTSNLENKVQERTAKIEEQKKEIEILLNHTTDSIKYAKRIQEAILPSNDYVKSVLPNAFIMYLPKDIVSGDFYWVQQVKNKVFVAAVDCTGHGVPGAFMTIIGHNGLVKASKKESEVLTPAIILNELNEEVLQTFEQQKEDSIRDGMDATVCAIDYEKGLLEFSGAYNPLFYIRNEQVFEIPGDKFPVGAHTEGKKEFTNHVIPIQKGDVFYLFSDGYADQFGGPKGKKFMYKNFRELLIKIHKTKLEDQKRTLLHEFHAWKGNLEQVDDILVIGLQF